MNNPEIPTDAAPTPLARTFAWLPVCVIGGVMVSALLSWSGPVGAAVAKSKAATRITFGIEPASTTGADGRPNFKFGVTPGATLFDHVAVVNYSSVPLQLQLYATDAVETAGGGFGLLPAAAMPTGVGSWISFPQGTGSVDVPAETGGKPGQVVVPFTVDTPATATPGDHVGGILASLQTSATNSSGQRVILDQRVGTRVFVRVSGPLVPKVVITNAKASYAGTANPFGTGQVKVSYVVSNTGDVDVSLVDQSVSVSGLLGSKRRVDVAKIPLLLPGASVPESVVVTGVWPEILLHAKESAQPLVPVGTNVPALAAVTSSQSVLAIPWTLLILIILVILGIYLLVRARSRRKSPTKQVR